MVKTTSAAAENKDEDLKCATTLSFFCDPVMLDCGNGHVFEHEAMKKWQQSKHDNCPVCKGKFTKLIPETEVLKLIKQRFKEDPSLMYEQYVTAERQKNLDELKTLIVKKKFKEAITFLKTKKESAYLRYAKIDQSTESKGQTALHLFAAAGCLEGLQAMVELGTCIEQVDDNEETAADIAKKKNNAPCFRYLENGETKLADEEDLDPEPSLPKVVHAKKDDTRRVFLNNALDGIQDYLDWRQVNAPGHRLYRLWSAKEVHWYHGQSGIDRATALQEQIQEFLDDGWDDESFKEVQKAYDETIALSSYSEHSLANCVARKLELTPVQEVELFKIKEGVTQYLKWCSRAVKGIRGMTRFSHLYHGQSGVNRAKALLAKLEDVDKDPTQYNYQLFQKEFQRAMAQSSHTLHSLSTYIENLFDSDTDDKSAQL